MTKKQTITIVLVGTLLTVFFLRQVIVRYYLLREVFRSEAMTHRMDTIPSELDLENLIPKSGTICDLGYAKFCVPDSSSVKVFQYGETPVIFGESDKFNFWLFSPHDSRSDVLEMLNNPPLKEEFSGNDASFIDICIRQERATLKPIWKIITEDRYQFAYNTLELFEKASTQYGSDGVYIYQAPETRGIIYLGDEQKGGNYAHLMIQKKNHPVAVGMHLSLPEGTEDHLMDFIPSLLSTFQFTVKVSDIDSNNKVCEIIKNAGITSQKDIEPIK